jgi:hypothetical protein
VRTRAITIGVAVAVLAAAVAIGLIVWDRDGGNPARVAARGTTSSSSSSSTTTSTLSSSTTTSTTAAGHATTTVVTPTTTVAQTPEGARLAAADAYARSRRGQVAMSIIDTTTGQQLDNRYGQTPYHSASLIKVVMALMKLEKVEAAGRGLTSDEQADLHQLIRYSNDDTGSKWWNELGQTAVITWLRQRTGLTHITAGSPARAWGATGITAHDWALLYAHLAKDDGMFSHKAVATVLTEMRNVIPEQRWGIPSVVHASTAAAKPGWYDEGSVWRIHSTAIVDFGGVTNRYVAVCLTDYAPHSLGMSYSEETCAGVGSRLLPPAV